MLWLISAEELRAVEQIYLNGYPSYLDGFRLGIFDRVSAALLLCVFFSSFMFVRSLFISVLKKRHLLQ